jgi:predicted metal-dependent hydrolase
MTPRRVGDIDYQLLPGTDRKTTDIVIERDGQVVVRPPAGLSHEQIDELVASKRFWIYRNLAEWRDLNATAVVREWVNGETFLYLGRSYRLSLQTDQECDLKLKEGRFCLNRNLIDEHGVSAAQKAFEEYYTNKASRRIKERVAHFAPKVGVKPKRVSIGDLARIIHRWPNLVVGHGLRL